LLLARFARRTLTGVIIMAITGVAAVAMIIDMICGAEVVLGRIPIVDRARLRRVLESVVEAPLDLVAMALVRAGFEAMALSKVASASLASSSS
jgi:hypothetical protein